MSERGSHEEDQLDWVVIAQAEGVLSAQECVSITEAAVTLRARARALGLSIEHVARDLVAATNSPAGDDA